MLNPDITLIAVAWLGSSLLVLPLLAFTARFGLVPLVEAVADARAAGRAPRDPALEQRIATLELRLAELSSASRAQGRPRYTAGATVGHPAH
ncbi:MAG: hypothetical protein ACJ8GN_21230 [Longimicrobiaceae bacterium]